MTAMQLNGELFRALGAISDDAVLMEKAVKYLKKLAAGRKDDAALMSREAFLERVERGEQQYARGEYSEVLPGESLTEHLRRLGYAV